MRFYHGTSKKAIPSILRNGLYATDHEEWGDTVCVMDKLEWAAKVAHYFGEDGVVVVVELNEEDVLDHPDYDGSNEEFATLHVPHNIHPNAIVEIIDTPSALDSSLVRPFGTPLRQWKETKMKQNTDFVKKLNSIFGID